MIGLTVVIVLGVMAVAGVICRAVTTRERLAYRLELKKFEERREQRLLAEPGPK